MWGENINTPDIRYTQWEPSIVLRIKGLFVDVDVYLFIYEKYIYKEKGFTKDKIFF